MMDLALKTADFALKTALIPIYNTIAEILNEILNDPIPKDKTLPEVLNDHGSCFVSVCVAHDALQAGHALRELHLSHGLHMDLERLYHLGIEARAVEADSTRLVHIVMCLEAAHEAWRSTMRDQESEGQWGQWGQ